MLHTHHFSLQNAVYFIMLPFLVPVLFTFYIQDVKLRCQKVNVKHIQIIRFISAFLLVLDVNNFWWQEPNFDVNKTDSVGVT
jgi:uncharacterized membrane protein YfhO